jgi:hypothetical protein
MTNSSKVKAVIATVKIGGLEFEDSWSPVVEYQIGDIVTYGGYSYVANARSTSRIPPSFPADWELLTTGFKVTGDWSQFRSYKVGEVGTEYVDIEVPAGETYYLYTVAQIPLAPAAALQSSLKSYGYYTITLL